MLKKIISITLIITMVLGMSSFVYAANGFSDVDEEVYSWAVTQIDDMADKGIINGYPDGSFQPANGITKIEAMLLISRILGIKEKVNSNNLEDIYSIYEEELDELDLQYPQEIAYLIYKGVFSLEDIKGIADDFKDPLLRYEAAEYLTKVLDAEADLSDTDTGFEDEDDIPRSSRAYVKYVKEEGIMQGMTETTFVPDFQVNRAQMAVMLHRVMERKELLFVKGEYKGISKDQVEVEISSGVGTYDISEAEFFLNGEECESKNIKSGNEVILVFENATLKRIEAIYFAPVVAKTATGEVKEITLTSSKSMKVINSANNISEVYKLYPTCEVYVGESQGTLSLIRLKDNVRLYIDKDDMVYRIDIIDTNMEIRDGTIKSMSQEDLSIDILRKDGTVETYYIGDEISVTRNNKDSSLSNVLVGDEVTYAIIRYNKITTLKVKSEIGSASGTITEILISKESSIVVKRNNEEVRYPITNSIKVMLDGKECEIYDLRLDMIADIVTDSGAITEINVNSIEEVGQLSGIVEVVNAAYGFLNLKTTNGETKQIFVSSSTKITADGAVTATKSIKNIYVGNYVFVIGKTVNGAFQASTIVIVSQ